MASIGYARVSRSSERLDRQLQALSAAGCATLFSEVATGPAEKSWDQRTQALDHLRPGDVLVVTALDRLALSAASLRETLAALAARGAGLRALTPAGCDATGPAAPLALALVDGVLAIEANRPREHRQAGIERAREAGVYTGRKPSVPVDHIRRLAAAGLRPIEIARKLRVGRSSVYRVLKRDGALGPPNPSRPVRKTPASARR